MGAFSSLIMLIHNFEPTKTSNVLSGFYTFFVLGANYIGTYDFAYLKENWFKAGVTLFIQISAVYVWFCNQNFEKSVM